MNINLQTSFATATGRGDNPSYIDKISQTTLAFEERMKFARTSLGLGVVKVMLMQMQDKKTCNSQFFSKSIFFANQKTD